MNLKYWTESDAQFVERQMSLRAAPALEITWVKADMVLGNARAGCTGAGICRISVQNTAKVGACNCTIIPVWLNHVNPYCLQLVVDKQHLPLKLRKQHFVHNKIEVASPILLPKALTAQLGLHGCRRVIPKKYTLCQDKNFFHHFLDLSKGQEMTTPIIRIADIS